MAPIVYRNSSQQSNWIKVALYTHNKNTMSKRNKGLSNKGGSALLGNILAAINLFFSVVIGLYFLSLLKGQQGNKIAVEKESRKELEKLQETSGNFA